jgi:hypothetical protein
MTVELEKEFYTAAFVASMQLGLSRTPRERAFGECFFTFAMVVVAIVQCMTVFGMSAFLVEKEAGHMDEFRLATGLFLKGGATMGATAAQDLCGSFSALALGHMTGQDSLELSDGTRYSGKPGLPVFTTYKMPSGGWEFDTIGGSESYLDKVFRVTHDAFRAGNWVATLQDFRVAYGHLFVAMVCLLWFYVLFEVRKIVKFVFILNHLYRRENMPGEWGGLTHEYEETTTVESDGSIKILRMTYASFGVGLLCVLSRCLVCSMMLYWGTHLLAATWNKLSLVLNAIAIGIVFELDVIIAYAVIDDRTMSRIECIEAIELDSSFIQRTTNTRDLATGLVLFVTVLLGAACTRRWQMGSQTQLLQTAATLCLFAGSPPEVSQDLIAFKVGQDLVAPSLRQDLIAPVPGFCESLLSLTCAPNVTGAGRKHGPCLVTDLNIFKERTVSIPADGQLFAGMYDGQGKRRSMAEWGSPVGALRTMWTNDIDLDLFRKVCVQLYQPDFNVGMRSVDPSLSLKTYTAPFHCRRQKLFKAVFGEANKDFEKWSATFNLMGETVIAALDGCREKEVDPHRTSAGPAPSPAGPAPAPLPSLPLQKFLRLRHHRHKHHRDHQEVSQLRIRG